MKVMIIGDVHLQTEKLNKLMKDNPCDIYLQCGEVYWPKFTSHNIIVPNQARFYFCDGNHDDHQSLKELSNIEVYPRCYYMKRGSTLTLPNGKVILFMGGALSIDKHYRTIGHDYFIEELITQKDIYNLPDIEIDTIISHTCPDEFFHVISCHYKMYKTKDPSQTALSYILKRYKPNNWYFGHFHISLSGQYNNCKWRVLNKIDSDKINESYCIIDY